jgi:hypothetical protein
MEHKMTKLEKHYKDALERIARCNINDLTRYCAKVDEIAVEALVKGEALEQDGNS